MKLVLILTWLFLSTPTAWSQIAEPQPKQPPASIQLSLPLVQELIAYLQVGGTRAQADGLVARVLDEAQAPAREAAVQRRIDEAIAKAKRLPAKPPQK